MCCVFALSHQVSVCLHFYLYVHNRRYRVVMYGTCTHLVPYIHLFGCIIHALSHDSGAFHCKCMDSPEYHITYRLHLLLRVYSIWTHARRSHIEWNRHKHMAKTVAQNEIHASTQQMPNKMQKWLALLRRRWQGSHSENITPIILRASVCSHSQWPMWCMRACKCLPICIT